MLHDQLVQKRTRRSRDVNINKVLCNNHRRKDAFSTGPAVLEVEYLPLIVASLGKFTVVIARSPCIFDRLEWLIRGSIYLTVRPVSLAHLQGQRDRISDPSNGQQERSTNQAGKPNPSDAWPGH